MEKADMGQTQRRKHREYPARVAPFIYKIMNSVCTLKK